MFACKFWLRIVMIIAPLSHNRMNHAGIIFFYLNQNKSQDMAFMTDHKVHCMRTPHSANASQWNDVINFTVALHSSWWTHQRVVFAEPCIGVPWLNSPSYKLPHSVIKMFIFQPRAHATKWIQQCIYITNGQMDSTSCFEFICDPSASVVSFGNHNKLISLNISLHCCC